MQVNILCYSRYRMHESLLLCRLHTICMYNPYVAGTVYMRFKQIADQINSTEISKVFCGRSLGNLIVTFWRRIFLHKYNYFSSFGAGNCVSNSSSKWMKNNPKQFGSTRVNMSFCTDPQLHVYQLFSASPSYVHTREKYFIIHVVGFLINMLFFAFATYSGAEHNI